MNKLSLTTLLCFLLASSAFSETAETESRSIKNSLDSVLREVKSKLEFFFTRSKQEQPGGDLMKSRLIKTPIETILPEAWLEDGREFLLPDIPTDVEVQIEDLNRRWEDGNKIPDIDRETFMLPRKITKFRKKQKLTTRYENPEDSDDEAESKIYFTEIIRKTPAVKKAAKEEKPEEKLAGSSAGEKVSDLLDKYSPFIYAELLKENDTSVAGKEDTKASQSVVVNKIDVYNDGNLELSENIDYEEEEDIDADLVTLEIAMVDTIAYRNGSEDTTDRAGFLPFIPPSVLEDIEPEYEVGLEVETENGTSGAEPDLTTRVTQSDPFRVQLKDLAWAFPVMVTCGSLLSLLLCYQCSVIFSLLPSLSTTSHCLVLGLLLSLLSSLLLTTTPTPLICAATRLLSPASYTLIFASLLVKFAFLVSMTRSLFLSTSYQASPCYHNTN